MIQISGKDNLVNLQNSPKLYYIIIIGVLFSTTSFAITRDLLSVLFFILSSITIFLILNHSPKDIIISINDNNIQIGSSNLSWVNIDSWAASEEQNWFEIVVKSTEITRPYYTFYVPVNHPSIKNFLLEMSQKATYDETVISLNWVHQAMKKLGMR